MGEQDKRKRPMKYKITYKRRSDRNKDKWTEFTEVLELENLYYCMKWIERNDDSYKIISIEPSERSVCNE